MAEKFDDFNSLSKEDLEMKKLRMEVSILQKQYDEVKRVGFFTRVSNYLQKNVGQILAILVLFGGFATPVLNYLNEFKKSQASILNNDILRIFQKADSDTIYIRSKAMVRDLSLQDPATLTPFILDQLNDGRLDSSIVKPVFERMFEISSHSDDRNIWDKFVFLFIKDNKNILVNELSSHADSAFNLPISKGKKKLFPILNTYIEIINDEHLLLLEPKKFTDALNILRKKDKEDPNDYDAIIAQLPSENK